MTDFIKRVNAEISRAFGETEMPVKSPELTFVCSICNKRFVGTKSFTKHLIKHRRKNIMVYREEL